MSIYAAMHIPAQQRTSLLHNPQKEHRYAVFVGQTHSFLEEPRHRKHEEASELSIHKYENCFTRTVWVIISRKYRPCEAVNS
jgi:hypothetical protein